MKVSFVIPVYKTEKYIEECVNSLLNQSFSDFEIVLVDDGSPDNCPAICDGFASRDERVKVVHKENGGLSDARNKGLLNSKGEYVIFVDSDDFWCDAQSLQLIINEVESKSECDFIGFNCYNYYSEKKKYISWKAYSPDLQNVINGSAALHCLVRSGTFPMSAWLKVLRRDFLINNNLFFVKGQISEDIPWFINVLDRCNKCSFVNHYIYAYRQNVSGSITNSHNRRNFDSLLDIVEKESELVAQRSFDSKAKKSLFSFLAYELCILLTYDQISKSDTQRVEDLMWLFDYDDNPKVRLFNMANKAVGLKIAIVLLKFYDFLRVRVFPSFSFKRP